MLKKSTKILSLVACSLLVFSVGCTKNTDANVAEQTPISVNTTTVLKGDLSSSIGFDGNLASKSEVIVTVKTPGKITSTKVNVGSIVKKGDLLFTMDSQDISSQKSATQTQYDVLLENEKSLTQALSNMESQITNIKSQIATIDKQLNDLVPAIETILTSKQPENSNETINIDTLKNSLATGLFDDLTTFFNNPISQYPSESIFYSGKTLILARTELNNTLTSLQQQIPSMKSNIENVKAQQKSLSTSLSAIDAQIKDYNVYAPISGAIGQFNVKVGEYPIANIPLTIVDDSSLILTANLTDTQISKVKVGDNAILTCDASGTKTYNAKVISVSPSANAQTSLYPVEIEIDNSHKELKAGFFAKASIITSTLNDAVYVSSSAILNDGEKNYVYVIDSNNIAKKVFVEIGIEDASSNVQITSGLNEGDVVATSNLSSLSDNALVNIINPQTEAAE